MFRSRARNRLTTLNDVPLGKYDVTVGGDLKEIKPHHQFARSRRQELMRQTAGPNRGTPSEDTSSTVRWCVAGIPTERIVQWSHQTGHR